MKRMSEYVAHEECPDCGAEVLHRETSHEGMTSECAECGWCEEYSDDPQGDRIREIIPGYNPIRYGVSRDNANSPDAGATE